MIRRQPSTGDEGVAGPVWRDRTLFKAELTASFGHKPRKVIDSECPRCS